MKKIWLVALHEYRRHVFTRRFLFGLLSVPLVFVLFVGLILLIISIQFKSGSIGYVDEAGILSEAVSGPKISWPEKPLSMLPYNNEADAQKALQAGTIGAYYILPADYLATGDLELVHTEQVSDSARIQFYNFIGANLLKNTDPAAAKRVVDGPKITIQSVDGSRSLSGDDWFSFLVPMVAGIGFIIAMFTSGGYLMHAVVEEKENRTMEVMVTSVTPNQLIAGKITGDTAIGLTQLLLWVVFIYIPIIIGRQWIEFLRGIQISGQTVLILLLVMLPSFVLVSALMAMIGATVSEAREGQQMTGLISLPTWIPYMLTSVLMSNPNSPIAMALSFLPLTAPVTMLERDGLTILPFWQIAVSSACQIVFAIGTIWLAGRAFRLGMLRYGKKLGLMEILAREKKAS
jgi:ABC-2 type transport system permease protein